MESEEKPKKRGQKRPSKPTPKEGTAEEGNPDGPEAKKVRLFSAKDFRSAIKSGAGAQAFEGFLNAIKEDPVCVRSYLEDGGSVLELLQALEGDAALTPALAYELVTKVLLQIGAKYPKFQPAAFDACRHLLNNFLPQINKMLGLSSSVQERTAVLKLLTTLVTISASLAKEILMNVNFNSTNLELLTKVTDKGRSVVRSAFIHFLTAFLVDGHYPTISIFLSKTGLLVSVVSGLRFDLAETVVMVLTAMKKHILENPSVTKTMKMKVFNTLIVKGIVNLYNWKGVAGLKSKKKQTTAEIIPQVDEVAKSQVSAAVHDFLLVLCTSHRHGVIFSDHSVGLGKKTVNALMYTVLESLDRPWEHSYAGELVVKICGACPDLARTMWNNLKPVLEPRLTDTWMRAVSFAEKLLDEFQPGCLEYCVKELNANQLAQIVSMLCMPRPIVNTLMLPEYDTVSTRRHVLRLLQKMVQSVRSFAEAAKNWPSIDRPFLTSALSATVSRNFPKPSFVLDFWHKEEDESSAKDHLKIALSLIESYKEIAPEIVENLGESIDFEEFFGRFKKFDGIDGSEIGSLRAKAAELFVTLAPSYFGPTSVLFGEVLEFGLRIYHAERKSIDFLHALLKSTGLFQEEADIDIWIDGVLNLKTLDGAADIVKGLVAIQGADEDSAPAQALTELASAFDGVHGKAFGAYANFVVLNLFHAGRIEAEVGFDFVSADLRAYMEGWGKAEATFLGGKFKGQSLMHHFQALSKSFVSKADPLESVDFKSDYYPNFDLNLVQALACFIARLIESQKIESDHLKFCSDFVKRLDTISSRHFGAILGNRAILKHSAFSSDDPVTAFVMELIKGAPDRSALEPFLATFRTRIVKKLKRKSSAVPIEVLETFELDLAQAFDLLETADVPSFDVGVSSYCLSRIASSGDMSKPLSHETIQALSSLDLKLPSPLPAALFKYLQVCKHSIGSVSPKLLEALLITNDPDKDSAELAAFLLERRADLVPELTTESHLDAICARKNVIFPILQPLLDCCDQATRQKIWTSLEPAVLKALQKPHKASQHLKKHYKPVASLIGDHWKLLTFANSVLKVEGSSEPFHTFLLKAAYSAILKARDSEAEAKDPKPKRVFYNMVMSFVHALSPILKKGEKGHFEMVQIFQDFLQEQPEVVKGSNLEDLNSNEAFGQFCKLCLKHGVGGDCPAFLDLLVTFADTVFGGEEEAEAALEMLWGHSKFLDCILGSSGRVEVLRVWREIVKRCPKVMAKAHVPVLLAAYRGTNAEEDRAVLELLKLYESEPDQTQFFDFKPFLWGPAAAQHYSLRTDLHRGLWRQPRMSDVLHNLTESHVRDTITNPHSPDAYDLDFFLPLFSHLLGPDAHVQVYHFTKRGALALTVLGLASEKKETRLAAYHVLHRFYCHVEARQTGKDNLVWLRFVEAVCKGAALCAGYRLNNFAATFLARTALILTNPADPMFLQITQYLAAKDALDFTTIPELYTLLHIPDVGFKLHRTFILEVLRDGVRSKADFQIFLQAMALKLVSELASSACSDNDTTLLLLDVFKSCCKMAFAVKILGELCLVPQLFSWLMATSETAVVKSLLEILSDFVKLNEDECRDFEIYTTLIFWLQRKSADLPRSHLGVLYGILRTVVERFPRFCAREHLELFLEKTGDDACKYLLNFGCKYVRDADFDGDHEMYNVRMLFFRFCKNTAIKL